LRALVHSYVVRSGLLGLATLSAVTCTADSPLTGSAEQNAIAPLPPDLHLTLNAKTSLVIGPLSSVQGDVAASGLNGSVLFDVNATQGFFSNFNLLASTVTVNAGSSVGHVFGNDITINGSAQQVSIGIDPRLLPAVPSVTPATPGTTNVSTNQNQSKQLCAGQYGTISLGINSTLSLNGGVYQVQKLVLADGARLEPSEPVVILVAGALTTNVGSIIRPSAQALNPMTSADVRIEVGGAINLGNGNQIRAHLLGAGKLTSGNNLNLQGAAWAKTIAIGSSSSISANGVFAIQAPALPAACNDNNPCTADACVALGSTGFCSNAPTPSGSSCEDGNVCNGAEACDGAGACQPGVDALPGTSCADDTLCNGDETCNGIGSCVPGAPPEVNDKNSCTVDACDPITGVSHDDLPDGTACSGIGTCTGGTCSVQGTVFTDDFVQFQSAPAQCSHWNDFLANQLTAGSYSSISLSGTFDLTGVTCNNPAAATQLCNALHNGNFASVFCDGHSWAVGVCAGMEVSVDASICNCSFSGNARTVRPCTFSWGGISTSTCDAPSQTMTVVCQ
jgi:hypothetical protein